MIVTERRTNSPNLLIPFVLIVLAALCVYAVAFAPVYHQHAVVRHGTDAELVRKCLEDNGPVQQWRKLDSSRYHKLCVLPDGRIGDQIVQLDDDGIWHEITSFVRQESTLDDVVRALSREAIKVWGR